MNINLSIVNKFINKQEYIPLMTHHLLQDKNPDTYKLILE